MKDAADTKTIDFLQDESSSSTRKRGRPATHTDKAAKQRAYRERLKEKGMRVVSRIVRDVRVASKPLQSDIIDLSEVRK